MEILQLHQELDEAEVVEELDLSTETVEHWVRLLEKDGFIETPPFPQSRNTRHRLTSAITEPSS